LRKVRHDEPVAAISGTPGGELRFSDMSEDAAFLREQARRCRRLARGIATPDVVATLNQMAAEYEARAEKMEQRS
jgi:hypothetical protein